MKTIAWQTASQIALRNCSKKVREESGYIGFFSGKEKQTIKKKKTPKHVVEHQKINHKIKNKKKKKPQMNDFSVFCVWEDV